MREKKNSVGTIFEKNDNKLIETEVTGSLNKTSLSVSSNYRLNVLYDDVCRIGFCLKYFLKSTIGSQSVIETKSFLTS